MNHRLGGRVRPAHWPDNKFEPGNADQGQPTHFFPRRNRFVFWVNVPKDFGDKELVWTITAHGKTTKAYATLRQDYFIDNMVLTSENGAIGGGFSSPEIRRNQAPVSGGGGWHANRESGRDAFVIRARHRRRHSEAPRAWGRPPGSRARREVKDIRMIPPRPSFGRQRDRTVDGLLSLPQQRLVGFLQGAF